MQKVSIVPTDLFLWVAFATTYKTCVWLHRKRTAPITYRSKPFISPDPRFKGYSGLLSIQNWHKALARDPFYFPISCVTELSSCLIHWLLSSSFSNTRGSTRRSMGLLQAVRIWRVQLWQWKIWSANHHLNTLCNITVSPASQHVAQEHDIAYFAPCFTLSSVVSCLLAHTF